MVHSNPAAWPKESAARWLTSKLNPFRKHPVHWSTPSSWLNPSWSVCPCPLPGDQSTQISSSASLKPSFRVELEKRPRMVIFCVFAHKSQSDSAHCSSPLLQQYLAKLRGSSVSAISLSSRLPYIIRGFLSPLVLICCFQAALFLIQVYHPCFKGIREKTSRVSKPLPTQ